MELELVEIWERLLEAANVGITDNFFDRGGHSLLAVRLMAQTQERFGVNLPLSLLFENPTAEHLAAQIRSGGSTAPSRSLIRMRGGSGAPLFLVHPGGGTVHCYHDLAHRLLIPGSIYALQAFGIEKGEEVLTTVEEMAGVYLKEIREAEPNGPYNFLGWSFGGYVAYEMARCLVAEGKQVEMVGLLDTYFPSILPSELRRQDEADLIVSLFGEEVHFSADRLRKMGRDERMAYVVEEAKKAGMIPPDFGVEEGKRVLTVFTANSRAVFTYHPEPFEGEVTVFKASERVPGVPAFTEDPTLGWGQVCRSARTVLAPGTHENMVRPPHVVRLAELVAETMKKRAG